MEELRPTHTLQTKNYVEDSSDGDGLPQLRRSERINETAHKDRVSKLWQRATARRRTKE